MEQGIRLTASNLKKVGMLPEKIAEITGLPLEVILNL
jgi:hypothetical protein